MPIVNTYHGSSSHHHRRSRSWRDTHVRSEPQPDPFTSSESTSNISNSSYRHSIRTVAVEHVDIPFVTAAALLFLLVVGYLFRRQTRSILSRFSSGFSSSFSYISYISDIGVNGVTSYFVQVRLGSAHYSPIRNLDSSNAGDYDAAVPGSPVSPISPVETHRQHHHQYQYQQLQQHQYRQTQTRAEVDAAPAPAYTVRTNGRNGRLVPSLHINVPPSVTPATIGLAKERYERDGTGTGTGTRTLTGFTQSPTSLVSPSSAEFTTSPASERSWSSWSWSPISAFTSTPSASSPTPIALQQQQRQRQPTASKPEAHDRAEKNVVANVASPRPSTWEASSRAGYFDTTTGRPCVPSRMHSEVLMGTSSPSATPPPQYTITIHASPRLPVAHVNVHANTSQYDGNNRSNTMNSSVQSTPDIVLSPVPWMPREEVPRSPPFYLTVPSRKSSRSRRSTNVVQNANIDKPLPYAPYVPRQSTMPTSNYNANHRAKVARPTASAHIARAHAHAHAGLATSTMKAATNVDSNPSTSAPSPMAPAPLQPLQPPRPLSRSSSVPPPQPVLPFDLEAVYPSSPPASDQSHSEGEGESESSEGSGSGSTWSGKSLWASRRVLTPSDRSRISPAPSTRGHGNDNDTLNTFTFYGSEKSEKSIMRDVGDDLSDKESMDSLERGKEKRDNSSDSEFGASPKEFFLALRRKGDQVLSGVSGANLNVGESAKPQVLKKKLFGRLSALAARARQAIEHELDSSDDEGEKGRSHRRPQHQQQQQHYQQQQQQTPARVHSRGFSNAFVIGDGDED